MRLHRLDPLINDAIEALDQHLAAARRSLPKGSDDERKELAWSFLSPLELSFVQSEITRCATDRVYYAGNYHVIQPEGGILTCMAPLYDLQMLVEEALQRQLALEGRAYLVILKPRQSGITEYSNMVMCNRTFFLPNAFTLTVAQNPKTAAWVQRKVNTAFDHLPWWMRVERQYHNRGEYLEFGRKDESRRSIDPGLGTVLVTTHAGETGGVAIGRTLRSLHMTETSRWPASDIFTSDIKPSLEKAPDPIVIAESTANGMNNFHHDLWQAATDDRDEDTDWTPLFLAGYLDSKNRRRIRPTQQPFILTDEENKITTRVKVEENFTITPEFWNFRRRGIKDSIAESGYPYGHLECYPISAREAFQSSGFSAFARHKLDQQEANVRRPVYVGEIMFQGRGAIPKILLEDMLDRQTGQYRAVSLPKRGTMGGRLYLWEQPDPNAIYYIAADAGEGIGQDFSVAEILRAGFLNEPDVQVGEWVGNDEPPEAFGRILYAIGYYFNRSEIAVEYNGPGRSTADYLMNQLEYPHIYIPRRTDHFKAQVASFAHWQTTPKTKPLLKNKMNETLLEDGILIQSEYVLDELRACETEGEGFSAMEGHDDAAISLCIALYCLRQTAPDLRRPAGSTSQASTSSPIQRALHPPVGAVIYGVYNQVYQLRHQKRSLQEAEQLVKENPGWMIRPIMVSKANTAFSVIHHGRGIENELYQSGMQDREITPGIVTQFAAATGRLEGMFNQASSSFGAASPGADAASWDSALGDLGSGELGEGTEML
jgi:hypothetical protein